jgi:polyisoprenoid-binding protein YceI
VSARWQAAALGALLLFASPEADALYARGGDASVKATVSATGGITFAAKTNDVRVADDGTVVAFAVPVATLKTGIDMRDNHLREHLEEPKYPLVTLSVTKSDVKLPSAAGSFDGSVDSTVTFHGVKRQEQVAYAITSAASGYRVHVEKLVLHLSDYGIQKPSFAGVTVKDEVTIAVDVPLIGG